MLLLFIVLQITPSSAFGADLADPEQVLYRTFLAQFIKLLSFHIESLVSSL